MSPTSPLRRASHKIPTKLKPVLAVGLNMGLSMLLEYLASPWISSDLAAVERPIKTLADYSSLASWRIVEILGYWIGGWDATQAASLSMLSLAPGLHYSYTYHPTHSPLVPTLTVSTLIDVLSVYLPMRFLRPDNNARSSASGSARITTALLISMIYQFVLQVASKKFLTTWLLGAGWELESVGSVHLVTEALMLLRAIMMLPVGWAVTEVFSGGENKQTKAEGIEEDVGGLLDWIGKMWTQKLSLKTRKILKRTALIAAYQAAGATAGVAATVKGGDLMGAAGLSGVWVGATAIVGVVLGWVGDV